MARLSTADLPVLDQTAINLTQLVARLQNTLLKPDSSTEHRLRTSQYERKKVNTNLEYARTLLLRLELDAVAIKVQSKRQEIQSELLEKRDLIQQLSDRLRELEEFEYDTDEDSSEGEDLLGEDTPSDDIDESDENPINIVGEEAIQAITIKGNASSSSAPIQTERENREQLFPSELRFRHVNTLEQPTDSVRSAASQINVTSTTEKMLSHNRTEQESLTDSLLTMAKALKSSSQAFSNSLESEKDVLGRTVEGLDQNKSSLDAAQKRMGYLKRMTEGRGWWGRMIMYAWIFGLMFIALLIVGFLPKLRF